MRFFTPHAAAVGLFLFISGTIQAQTGCHSAFTFSMGADSLTFNFHDASTSGHAITSWAWTFGDGGASTSQNPAHTYAHDGTFNVCLTIHDDHGCSATTCHDVVIHPVHHLHHGQVHHHGDVHGHHTGAVHYVMQHDGTLHHVGETHHGGAIHHSAERQGAYALSIAPNPLANKAALAYVLEQNGPVLITVYDLSGKNVLTLVNESRTAGPQTEVMNAETLEPGVYVVSLIAGNNASLTRIVVTGN